MAMSQTIAMPISSFLPNLGGAEVGLHNIASRLQDRGHFPVVMAPAPHVARLETEGWSLPYAVKALPPKAWSLLRRSPRFGFWILDRYFARMQARYRFDCWHCTMGYPTGVALVHFARRREGIRHLIRCAGEDIQRDPEIGYGARLDPHVDRMVREYLPSADMLIAISDSVADEYREIDVAEERIRRVPNGVDLARFESAVDRGAVRARYGLDPDGFVAQANRAACLGCEGKWAIHPSQIPLANQVNSPSDKEVTHAKRILEAMEKAQKEGKGAVALDGRLIDIASIKQAEVMVKKAEQVAAAG